MDLDGDGVRDVISGCWPGPLHFFRGAEDGTFAPSTPLTYADGEPIELGDASTVFAADWDRDGDLDLLVGEIAGEVFLVPNASGGKALQFQAAQPVRAGGKELVVEGDSAPVVADWDGDGRHDLLVGSGNGAVTWYRGLAVEGAPLLASGVVLVAPAPGWGTPAAKPGSPAVPGMRSKVAVTDWNGDGRLDLLVGDFGSAQSDAPGLTPEQSKRRDELVAEQQTLAQGYSKRWQAALEAAAKELGISAETTGQGRTPSDKEQLQRLHARAGELLTAEGANQPYQERMSALGQELAPLMPKHEMHGYVWFFERTSGGVQAPAAAPADDTTSAAAMPSTLPPAAAPAPAVWPPCR